MNTERQKRNWLIAAALWMGFLATFFLDLTGLAAHQWLGLAIGLLALYHLARHWTWVQAVASRVLVIRGRSRLYLALDAGLLLGFCVILITGLVISSWLSLPLAGWLAWRQVHVLASVTTLAAVTAKIGLHWHWIVGTARRLFESGTRSKTTVRPGPIAPGAVSRRSFLALMGIAGMAAALAACRALDNRPEPSEQPPAPPAASVSSKPAATDAAPGDAGVAPLATPNPTTPCTVRCPNGCSFPGRCRRYTDQNNNGRCDLGECL
ncbi:MAG: hypothetical protein ACUVX9_05820 [Anaerolineae bacterium]